MAKGLFAASSSIAKLYHAKFDDVATGLHREKSLSSSAITSVFAQLSSKMSPHDGARRSGSEMVFGWLHPSGGNAGEKLGLIANTSNQERGAF
jgi:hypothetical protein